MSLACRRFGAASSFGSSVRRPAVPARASGRTAAIAEGARVKVTGPVKVFHAAKHPEGLELQGLEGTVKTDVTQFKGKVLSANLQYKVEFQVEKDGGNVKVVAHMSEEEIQAL